MEIKIKNPAELTRLMDALAQEIVDANICHRLYSDLIDSIKQNKEVFRESNTFWNFTFLALDDARVIRLCRVFDQESKSLNLYNFLVTIKANLHFFDENHFRERLKDNAFIELLVKNKSKPDVAQLENDILFASIQNPLVKKLMIWRNNIIAHLGAKVSLGKDQVLSENPLDKNGIETLLDESFKIYNIYSNHYRASTYSRKVNGHDDYKSILKYMKIGLKKCDHDIQEEINRST